MGNPRSYAELNQLKNDVIELCREYDLWCDSSIYVNGNRYSATSHDQSVIIEEKGLDPRDYFDFVRNKGNIFSMSFEGPLYMAINGYDEHGEYSRFRKEFNALFESLDLFYEQGDAWNLTCFANEDV